MRLALTGQAHYPDFSSGYELYVRRSRGTDSMSGKQYAKAVKMYCKELADRLVNDGVVDLPNHIGTVSAVTVTRKPQFRSGKFVGYGKIDWETGQYDGSLKAFGIAFLPVHGKNGSLRSLGFVANRRLFKKMKETSQSENCSWVPLEFNEEMV